MKVLNKIQTKAYYEKLIIRSVLWSEKLSPNENKILIQLKNIYGVPKLECKLDENNYFIHIYFNY